MRTAIVTGGGSGIGQAVGVALCAAGWTVVIAGRKVETLDLATVATVRDLNRSQSCVRLHEHSASKIPDQMNTCPRFFPRLCCQRVYHRSDAHQDFPKKLECGARFPSDR